MDSIIAGFHVYDEDIEESTGQQTIQEEESAWMDEASYKYGIEFDKDNNIPIDDDVYDENGIISDNYNKFLYPEMSSKLS